MKTPFKLKNAALLMALAAIYPMTAHSAAGVAQYAVGDVSVRRGANTVPLTKGQPIDSGDNIVTGNASQAQLRFSDGGLVSLSPNTQFNIDRYVDGNDASKDSFSVRFLRGGMRAITGLIGKRNTANYKVTTNTATIGIRGSAFSARINDDGTMDVSGEQDAIEVCTNSGCVGLVVGESVRVTSNDALPTRTTLRSNVPPLVARQDLFVPEILIPITQPAPVDFDLKGVSALFAFGNGSLDTFPRGGLDPSNGMGHFTAGQLTAHTGRVNGHSDISSTVTKTNAGDGSFGLAGLPESGSLIGWGYWDGGTESSGTAQSSTTSFQGVHYVVGRPTPQAQMPVTGAVRYDKVGGTAPTAYNNGVTLFGTLLGAGLNVDFGAQSVYAHVDTRFTTSGSQVVDVSIASEGVISGSTFYSNGNYGDGSYSGYFIGPNAARAGMIYEDNHGTVGHVTGALAFGSAGAGSGGQMATQSGIAGMFTSTDGFVFDQSRRGGQNASNGSAYFVGSKLLKHDDQSGAYSGSSVFRAGGNPINTGALGSPGDADFIGWGYWVKGDASGQVYNGSLAGVHYLVGRPTPTSQMPTTGTATYSLAGGTAPTATNAGTSIFGTLVSATLNANFSNGGGFNATVNTNFVKDGVNVPVSISDSGGISGSAIQGCGKISGFFSGTMAARAGILYKGSNPTVGVVRGAARAQAEQQFRLGHRRAATLNASRPRRAIPSQPYSR